MTFWSGEKLEDRLGENNIITPFEPNNIDCNAYTLTVGKEVYVTLHHKIKDVLSYTKKYLYPDEPVTIPPGQFAFLITKEILKIPTDSMAFISMKSTTKLKGLINVSGFHVDPGYRGKLIFAVFNAGPTKLNLQRDQPLFLIWFCDLDRVSSEPYVRTDKDNSYYNISANLIDGVPGQIDSIKSLAEKIETNKQAIYTLNALIKFVIPFVLALFVFGLGLTADRFLSPTKSAEPSKPTITTKQRESSPN